MKTFAFCLMTLIFTSFTTNLKNQSKLPLFRAIYENQKRYFKDSLASNADFKQIVDFGDKDRQSFYKKHNLSINSPGNYIILEGNSSTGVVYTGILFEQDREVAYRHTPAHGWQVAEFKKSEFESLSHFSYASITVINKVSAWDTFYINRQKNTIGGTGLADSYNFIASRVITTNKNHIIETIGFGEFNILY